MEYEMNRRGKAFHRASRLTTPQDNRFAVWGEILIRKEDRIAMIKARYRAKMHRVVARIITMRQPQRVARNGSERIIRHR